MRALFLVLVLVSGCASSPRHWFEVGPVQSAPIFHVGEVWRFDWGFFNPLKPGWRIEHLQIVAIRSDGWLLVHDIEFESGQWYINPALAIGVQGPVSIEEVPRHDHPQPQPQSQPVRPRLQAQSSVVVGNLHQGDK